VLLCYSMELVVYGGSIAGWDVFLFFFVFLAFLVLRLISTIFYGRKCFRQI